MKRKDANSTRKRKPSVIQSNVKPVRIVILGSIGVGKSESTYRHQLEIDSEFLLIELTDTAGENSAIKLSHCVSKGDVAMVLYSITDRKSFDEATRIVNFIKDKKNSLTLTLVGTKTDLEHFRAVDKTEGLELARELDAEFHELSISDQDGYQEVTGVVRSCVKRFLQRDKNERPQKTNHSSLGKMKEGLIRRTGSLRRKSVAF